MDTDPGFGRGLLIRRHLANGELAFFSTWCPAGTPTETLVKVEGHRWAIEDGFETAKNELGLDHNETRSWHGWHRYVSLVMPAFAMMNAIRRPGHRRRYDGPIVAPGLANHRTFPAELAAIAARLPNGTEIELWWADEARIGQKNKITRRWARRGTRPSAPHDQRTMWAYIFGAICPKKGKGAGLVLPHCGTDAMNSIWRRSRPRSIPAPMPSSSSTGPDGT